MIETPEQLNQAIEQMGRMQRILESYKNEILTKNPRNFAIFAGGPLVRGHAGCPRGAGAQSLTRVGPGR